MEKSKPKKHYWGITKKGEPFFTGSFKDCWEKLVDDFGDQKLGHLYHIKRIKIERIR